MRFGFLINEVLTGLRRNVTMTIAMILTTAISIGLFGGGLLVVRLADQSRDIYLDRVESQVFLTDDVSANDPSCDTDPCQALRQRIEDRDDVRSVRFLNRDDAYDVVQDAAMRAWEGEAGFRELLSTDDDVRERLGDNLDTLFDPAYALRNLGAVFGRVEELKRRLEDD